MVSPAFAQNDPGAIQAIQAIEKKQYSSARSHIQQSADPIAHKLYHWMLFHHDQASVDFVEINRFLHENPNWPHQLTLRRRAEQEMPDHLSNQDMIAWFEIYPPLSVVGMDRYMSALIKGGQSQKATEVISTWWATTLMDRSDQKRIYGAYKHFITHDAHRRRFDRLLYEGHYTNARAVAQVLGSGYPQLAEARIALAQQKDNVGVLINNVPRHLQSDPGLIYERLRWRRRKGLNLRAMEILHKPPPAGQLVNLEDWWQERHIIIRRLLEEKKYESAYLLAAGHQQKEGLTFAQAEFLAGWISLNFLGKPSQAYQHFQALNLGVTTPLSKSRANYWAGLAARNMGVAVMADHMFAEAAKYQTTFYGQLAAREIGIGQMSFDTEPPLLLRDDEERFARHEFIKVAQLCHQAVLPECVSLFLQRFVKDIQTPKAYFYAAQLVLRMGQEHDAVQILKSASNQGMFISAEAYPVVTGHIKGRESGVEGALIHALIRQESMFDPAAQSAVGARGLMQLMPETAKATAKKMKLHYTHAWLTEKPEYNILLGSNYLAQMLERFDGSYPLAIAAYNAGPNRVAQWLEDYGDPRRGEIAMVDWIELIPIYETRNYVQRVIEATHVYRLSLGTQIPELQALLETEKLP